MKALDNLADRFRRRERGALARAISVVEDRRPGFRSLLDSLLRTAPAARRVGLTGPAGAGKSSLVASLAAAYREGEEEVGIVAVDPTSPYSGGALLGDRIRMNDLTTDSGIFIRSMASRGSRGGLATTTKEVVDLMDAFGLHRILVETVGVGQTALDIAGAADTIAVVLVPESGDSVQAMKAGLMEIADIFVINKADRPGAERLAREVRLAIALRTGKARRRRSAHHGVDLARAAARKEEKTSGRTGKKASGSEREDSASWAVPVLLTNALSGEGSAELLRSIEDHRGHAEASGELLRRRRRRAETRVVEVIEREIRRRARFAYSRREVLEGALDRIARGDATPYSIAEEIMKELFPE